MARAPRPSKQERSTEAESAALAPALFPPRLELFTFSEEALAGAGPEYADILESICGVADDSQAVEQYDGTLGVTQAFVAAHQQPAAQVQWNANLASLYTNPGNVSGVRWGSGTMVGPDVFLTCGHLFDADPNGWTVPRQNGSMSAISPQEIAGNMHLNFLYQVDATGTMRAEQSFPITALLEFRLGGLDMAVCRVGGNPGTIYGWTEVSSANPAVGDMLAIIGHPAGMPKRIEAGPATAVTANRLEYNDIDTLGGNSGSGILQASTGRVVGVHTNGGCNSAGTGSNSGVAIAAILAVSPTLQGLPPGGRTAGADDVHIATPLAQDIGVTYHAGDTVSLRDQIGTALALDVGTLLARDTNRLQDLLGTALSGDVGTRVASDTGVGDLVGSRFAGDVGTFGSGDDPNNTWVEGVVDPGSVVVDPPWRAAAGSMRPFVQAIPSRFEGVGAQGEATVADALLADLEAVIAAQRSVLATLESVHEAVAALAQSADGG